MRCRPTPFLSSLPLPEWEDVSPNFTISGFRGLNLATDILLDEKLFVSMVLVVVSMVSMVSMVVGARPVSGLTCRSPVLRLTFCLLLGGDVSSSIWLGPVMSVGCIFPISSVRGPDTDTDRDPRKFSLKSAKLGLCSMEAAKLLSVRNEEETGEG